MSYEINIRAYELVLKIEVGLREYLIDIIRKNDISNWISNFLGTNQRETIGEIVKRINNDKKNEVESAIQDIYLVKLNKAAQTFKDSGQKDYKIYHPFYYLNWPDMESVMRFKPNLELLDADLGKTGRELIVTNLSCLNGIRNDVAHSRYINEKQFNLLKSSYDQIRGLIEDFDYYIDNQSTEENVEELLTNLSFGMSLLKTKKILGENEIIKMEDSIKACLRSFWLNSLNYDLIGKIRVLERVIVRYKAKSKTMGGSWEMEKIVKENVDLINSFIKL